MREGQVQQPRSAHCHHCNPGRPLQPIDNNNHNKKTQKQHTNNNNTADTLTPECTYNLFCWARGMLHTRSGEYALGLGRPPGMRQHRAARRSLTARESTGHWQRLMPRQTRAMSLKDRHVRR